MARFVFFSFAYDDVKNFKVNVVRHSWLINKSEETFTDGSIWEKEKTKPCHYLPAFFAAASIHFPMLL